MRLVLCHSLLNIESTILSKSLREIESAAILFCYGPIVYYISGGGGGGVGGLEGGYNFWKGLILGDQFWKCTKCDGGRNFKTQDWHYMLWLLKHIIIETKTKNTFSFISKPKSRLTTLCRLKILPAQNSCVHCIYDQRSRPRLCHWMKNIDRRLLPNISIHIHASDVLALLSDVELYNSSASLALTYAD